MPVVRSLIPKKLTLIKRVWTNKSGYISYSYRARIAGYLDDLRIFKIKFGKDFRTEEKCPYIFSAWKSAKTSNQYDARSRWMKKAGERKITPIDRLDTTPL